MEKLVFDFDPENAPCIVAETEFNCFRDIYVSLLNTIKNPYTVYHLISIKNQPIIYSDRPNMLMVGKWPENKINIFSFFVSVKQDAQFEAYSI